MTLIPENAFSDAGNFSIDSESPPEEASDLYGGNDV
jgi:hypothetical protein